MLRKRAILSLIRKLVKVQPENVVPQKHIGQLLNGQHGTFQFGRNFVHIAKKAKKTCKLMFDGYSENSILP